MRIIAGEMRSRTILTPKGTDTRPTLDRTRENVGVDISTVSDVASLGRIILGVIQIILYIISDGADIAAAPDHKHTQKIPRKPDDVGKASTVDLQYVGVRMGAAIRSARARAEADENAAAGSTPGGSLAHHSV